MAIRILLKTVWTAEETYWLENSEDDISRPCLATRVTPGN